MSIAIFWTSPTSQKEQFLIKVGFVGLPCPGHSGAPVGSGQDSSRLHRLRQGQSPQNQYGVAGLADPNMKARVADLGGDVLALSPTDFGKLIADETEKWAKVIRAANIKAE